jgi:penicillin amidase
MRKGLVLFSCVAATAVLLIPSSGPANDGVTTLGIDGEVARIYRDAFGVPHVFADTNAALFTAYGYVVAQDRLWQLEVARRTARGQLAEILGPSFLAADRNARTFAFTAKELDAQNALLTGEEREIFTAYTAGINRFLSDVVSVDPANELPYEFHALQIGVPALWTVHDTIVVALDVARRFGRGGGQELANQILLTSLAGLHCGGAPTCATADEMFNDLRWINDPDAPVSVPREDAFGKIQRTVPPPHPSQLLGARATPPTTVETDAEDVVQALDIPRSLGSHAWVVSPAKSSNGYAMLFGGPQVPFDTPAFMHEVQLTGGNGFHAAGTATVGLPFVVIGRTDHIAWTTTGASPTTRTPISRRCAPAGPDMSSIRSAFHSKHAAKRLPCEAPATCS